MTDREKAARAIGYLEGFSSIVWAHVGEKLADESVAAYDDAVETLRKMVFDDDAVETLRKMVFEKEVDDD